MSNPFIKRETLSSRERTKILESRTLMGNLNNKPSDYETKLITMKDDKLIRCINYATLLQYVKGFYQLEDNCNNLSYHVSNISEGKYSYVDFNELEYLTYSGSDPSNPIYIIDENALQKGLIYIKGQIFPTSKERFIKFPIPIQKTFICRLPDINILEAPTFGDHISLDIQHKHFLSLNGEITTYSHDPEDTDISSNHPIPFEFPNKESNNTLTLFPTIPKSSVIKGAVQASSVSTTGSGGGGGGGGGANTNDIINANRNCETERVVDPYTGVDLNWTGKQCITCES